MFGADLVLLLALLLAHGRDLLTCTPGPPVDGAALAREVALRHQPPAAGAEDAWPHIAAAAGLLRDIFDESPERPSELELPPMFDFEVLLPRATWPEDPAAREATRREAEWALAEFGRRAGPAMLDRAASSQRAEPPPPLARDAPRPGPLSQLRQLARMCRVRAYLAAQSGDWPTFASSIAHMHAFARIAAQQCTLIGRLVGTAVEELALAEIRYTLLEHRDIPEPVLAELLARTGDRDLWPPRSACIESSRAEAPAMLNGLYTPGGVVLPSEVGEMTSNPFAWALRAPDADRRAEPWNLLGVLFASRDETLAVLDGHHEVLASVVDRPRDERERELRELPALPARHGVSRELIGLLSSVHERWLSQEDVHSLHLTGTRIMLALELHHRRRGRYPATLDALTPEFLPELPDLPALGPEPISGLPFIYRLTDPAADPHGRGYLLYSAGADGVDHGGKAARWRESALRSPQPGRAAAGGEDYILNVPRPGH